MVLVTCRMLQQLNVKKEVLGKVRFLKLGYYDKKMQLSGKG